jgi:hypothetical protein
VARKRKETVERTIKLKQSELKAAILDASRHKANAAAHSGFHGQSVKQFCERTSFDRTVFGWLRKLHDMNDPLKVQAIVRQFLMGVELLEWNAQGDLFDIQEEIANKATLDDAEDEEDDPRPAFLKNSLPLDEAEQNFDAAKEVAAAKASVAKKRDVKPNPLRALAGREDLN